MTARWAPNWTARHLAGRRRRSGLARSHLAGGDARGPESAYHPAASSPDLIRGSIHSAARMDPRVKPADDGNASQSLHLLSNAAHPPPRTPKAIRGLARSHLAGGDARGPEGAYRPAASSPDLIRGSIHSAARMDPRVKPADDGNASQSLHLLSNAAHPPPRTPKAIRGLARSHLAGGDARGPNARLAKRPGSRHVRRGLSSHSQEFPCTPSRCASTS